MFEPVPALAPPVAADAEKVSIDWTDLMRRTSSHAASADIAIIEGAGGLLTPLTWRHSAIDLARHLDARALIVARNTLGTINQSLLTIRALQAVGVEILGLVLSAATDDDASVGRNAAALAALAPGVRIATLPRVADLTEAAQNLTEVARWLRL